MGNSAYLSVPCCTFESHPHVHVSTGRRSCLPFCSWPQGECYWHTVRWRLQLLTEDLGERRKISDVSAWAWDQGGPFETTRVQFSLCDCSWEMHWRKEMIWAETTIGKEVRMLARWAEKQVCLTCFPACWVCCVLCTTLCCHHLSLALERALSYVCVWDECELPVFWLEVVGAALWHAWACTFEWTSNC